MNKNEKDSLLMVFVKNPILGTAKTRLAASIGDQKALDIYIFLLQYTAYICSEVNSEKMIHYSKTVIKDDMFSSSQFLKTSQITGNLGQKMFHAFEQAFNQGYKRVLIIGSDCYELTQEIIMDAFDALNEKDFVIGPAKDGGYYLLGMKQVESAIFKNKKWSTNRLYHDTLIDLEALNYSYAELPTLSDIDYLEDLPQEIRTKFCL